MAKKPKGAPTPDTGAGDSWQHSAHEAFVDYYREASVSPAAMSRFRSIRDAVLRIYGARLGTNPGPLQVADIGCGAGTQGQMWEQLGHTVLGIDVNEPLVTLARQRAAEQGTESRFWVGSATDLPWKDTSVDICILPELLEHVPDWQRCLDEACRVLRPGGILYLSTTNKLCPRQQEFRLPLYSWYPGLLKRLCVRMAKGPLPGIAGYATYPAVNWFTPTQLAEELRKRGLTPLDRFEFVDERDMSSSKVRILGLIRSSRAARWLALAATPYSSLMGIK